MRTASLVALVLVVLGALVLSGCPAQPQYGPGYGTPRTGMLHDLPGMGDGGRDRLHMPVN